MDQKQYNRQLFEFLSASPTPFHAVSFMADKLRQNGFVELSEKEPWNVQDLESAFIIRDDGSLIAFTLGGEEKRREGFRMLGAHTDSPCLQVKPLAADPKHSIHQLPVEIYGGPLLATWFDRDLSLAGRVVCRLKNQSLTTLLVDFQRPMLTIPSLAIHLDREANVKRTIDKQTDIIPLFGQQQDDNPLALSEVLIKKLEELHPGREIESILGADLFCYDCQPPSYNGNNREFICAGKLDNLLSCHAALSGMLNRDGEINRLMICSNHEEVGSTTAAGAGGSFLKTILKRLYPDPQERHCVLARSLLVSMDNAHAVHPNFAAKSDPAHLPLMNHGPVIKSNANHRYATTAASKAIFRAVAEEVEVPLQDFVMRNDLLCGSTIGPMTAAELGVNTIDIGAPTLGMHSIREMTGSRDPLMLYSAILHFLNRPLLPEIIC
ncbi:MAG: M18 family aminopeptidase [Thermodesulfobacteriota bacterium]